MGTQNLTLRDGKGVQSVLTKVLSSTMILINFVKKICDF